MIISCGKNPGGNKQDTGCCEWRTYLEDPGSHSHFDRPLPWVGWQSVPSLGLQIMSYVNICNN